MKKSKLHKYLALWDECRTRAAKLGLEIGVDEWNEYPLWVARSAVEPGADRDMRGCFNRPRELMDWLEGYESAEMNREAE